MKKLYFLLPISILAIHCQQEDGYQFPREMTTRDSLLGRWDLQYTFTHTYSDSNYITVIDSFYYGTWTPYSFLVLKNDSTQRQFLSESPFPPIYGNGASGRWRYDPDRRLIWVSAEIYSRDTGWVDTSPHPPPNDLMPIYWLKYLDNDSLVLFIRSRRDTPPTSYRRIYDIYKRRR